MIDILFEFAGDYVLVKIQGSSVLFGSTAYGAKLAPISGLKLSKEGVEKEFPDLRGNILWKEEAVKRFTDKIKRLRTEKSRAEYIIEDLRGHGYIPLKLQEAGMRPVKLS